MSKGLLPGVVTAFASLLAEGCACDSICEATRATDRALRAFESDANVTALREQVIRVGNAPFTVTCIVLAEWSIERPKHFADLVERLPESE